MPLYKIVFFTWYLALSRRQTFEIPLRVLHWFENLKHLKSYWVCLYWPFQGGTSVVVPYFYLFLLSVFILLFSYFVVTYFLNLGSWMTIYLGKSCSFGLPRVHFVNCRQFMYLVISLLVLRAGYGIWLCRFLVIACLFTSPMRHIDTDRFLHDMAHISH